MTQPNDLPPLPEPTMDGDCGSEDFFTKEQMTAYGLQCAEAAVERERARCVAICNEQAKIHQEAAIRAWRRHHTKVADRIERQQTTARICAFNIALPPSPK